MRNECDQSNVKTKLNRKFHEEIELNRTGNGKNNDTGCLFEVNDDQENWKVRAL